MQSPTGQPGEAGDQVLQVLELLEELEAAEEVKPLIVTTATVAEDAQSNFLPGRSSGPSTQPSQVGQRAGPPRLTSSHLTTGSISTSSRSINSCSKR